MHKTWFTWTIVTTIVVAVFFAFNYHGGKDAVPLSEIFPDEEAFPAGAELVGTIPPPTPGTPLAFLAGPPPPEAGGGHFQPVARSP